MTEEERLLSAASQEAEASIEKSLRPQFLAQYICLLYTSDAADE